MILGYILIVVLLFLDQIVKYLSLLFEVSGNTLIKVLIPKVLEFHHIINEGASFGMLEGRQGFFAIMTIIFLIIFGYFFYEVDFKKKKVFSIATILLIAGALGNAIDRLFRGGVIDMINMPILNDFLGLLNISPFIFNLADLYMNVGIVLFMIDLLFLERKRTELDEESN